MHLWRVWGRLVKMLQSEGSDTTAVEMFYRAVIQEVIVFVSEFLVMLTAMEKMMEWAHTGFLQKIMGKRAHMMADRTQMKT